MEAIPVPAEHAKAAAGRIYRNEVNDPIGGLVDGQLVVLPDWRWERFLESRSDPQPGESL